MKRFYLLLLLCGACFVPTLNAQAELASFEISATINEIWDNSNALEGGVQIGDVISGTYTVDLATPDNDPSVDFAYYPHAPVADIGFKLQINGNQFNSDPTAAGFNYDVGIVNSGFDHYHAGSWGGGQPLANGASVDDIMLDLFEPTGTALDSTALLPTPPELTGFEYRDLMIYGHNPTGGDYYHIQATVTSLKAVGDAGVPSNVIAFKINATVADIYDTGNALANAVNMGDSLTATYYFDPLTADQDPSLEMGYYLHSASSAGRGVQFSVGALNIDTTQLASTFSIDVYNGSPSPDFYGMMQYGLNLPITSSANLFDIGVFIDDPSGTMLNSDALPLTPPTLPPNGIRDFYFFGQSANGLDYYSVVATINSIELVSPQSPLLISPAEGMFAQIQQFDAALILNPDLPGVEVITGSLNGADISQWLSTDCIPGGPNNAMRQTFVCANISSQLVPGLNLLDVTMKLMDGSIVNSSVRWQLLD